MIDLNVIVVSSASLGAVGAAAAGLLAGASKFFAVEQDPRVEAIIAVLPGANCGGCGFPGCAGFAQALVENKAELLACNPGGNEVAQKIGEILGRTVDAKTRQVVRLRCQGADGVAAPRLDYSGVDSCRAVMLVSPGGSKACPRACEGLGDCVRVCSFDAIKIGPNGLPVIDEEKCTACGKCVGVCPKEVLVLDRYDSQLFLACHTDLSPKEARQACEAACGACKLCLRACPYDALTWDGRRPVRDDEKCVACGLCVDACKQGSLVLVRGLAPDPAVRAEAERLAAERKAAEAARKAAAKAAAAAKPAAGSAAPAASSGVVAADQAPPAAPAAGEPPAAAN